MSMSLGRARTNTSGEWREMEARRDAKTISRDHVQKERNWQQSRVRCLRGFQLQAELRGLTMVGGSKSGNREFRIYRKFMIEKFQADLGKDYE